ncbi:Uncharacterised protein r2_g3745 [Pycnogonum litorale]
MEELKKRRTVLKRKVTILFKKIRQEDEPNELCIQELESHVQKIKEIDQELVLIQPEEDSDGDYEYILQIKSEVFKFSNKLKIKTEGDSKSIHFSEVPFIKIQDIPPFNGNTLEWLTFWDNFNHVVHSSTYLSNCQKFTHLRRFLTGSASKAIEGWATTDAKYLDAITHLKKRFGDEEDIKQALWCRLLKLDSVKSENSVAMRCLLDTTRSCIRSLESIGVSPFSYVPMLKTLLRQRIPPNLDTQWLLSSSFNENATIDHMLDFFERIVRAKEQTALITNMQKEDKHTTSSSVNKQKDLHTIATAVTDQPCFYCDKPHKIWDCPLSSEEKKKLNLSVLVSIASVQIIVYMSASQQIGVNTVGANTIQQYTQKRQVYNVLNQLTRSLYQKKMHQ